MGSRARHALIPLALVAFAHCLAAQNPPTSTPSAAPARDSMAREQILNELIPEGMPVFAPRGFQAAAEIPGLGRHWHAEAEAGLARLQQLGSGLEPKGQANIAPYFGLGLQLRF